MKLVSYWVIILSVCLLAEAPAFGFTFAELSYDLVVGKCPKDPKCATEPKDVNQSLMNTIAEDAYLSGLAEIRSESMNCGVAQIQHLEKNPVDNNTFTDFYFNSLAEVARLKFTMDGLRHAITSSEKARHDYKTARLQAEAILATLPYTQTDSVRLMINGFLAQQDFFKTKKIHPLVEKTLKKEIQVAITKAKNQLAHNKNILDKGIKNSGRSFSTKERESLAQDVDLIEEYRQRTGSKVKDLAPIACSVDAKYGKGASIRDNTVFAVSILGTGVAMGLTKLGVKAAASSITGGAAMGAFSIRSAGVLRIITSLASVAVTLQQVERHCLNGVTLKGQTKGTAANRCETNIIKSLNNDRCVLSIVINAIGTRTVLSDLKHSRLEMAQTGKVIEKGISSMTKVPKAPAAPAPKE